MEQFLWIGSYMNEEVAGRMQKLGYVNPASVLSQKNILEGIESVLDTTFDTIGVLSFDGFPKDKDIFIKRHCFSHKGDSKDVLAPVFNVKYINKLFSKSSLKQEVKKHLGNKSYELIEVFIYEMRSACLEAAKVIKKLRPNAKIHLIVPDLPQFMDLNASRIKRVLKDIDWIGIKKNMKYIDDYIFYSEHMANYLGVKEKKWMVMEGSINNLEIVELPEITNVNKSYKNIVMYSGGIKKDFGIENLLKSMEFLDGNYELWLTGGGDFVDSVKEHASKDSRIKYYGFLSTRDDLLKLQSQASMFINMRDPNELASKYCFPSKLFEYMLTGKPVLSCRLGGIPEEYYQYIVEFESIDPQAIADSIRHVAMMPIKDQIDLGNSSREYIKKEKNSLEQSKRILSFIRCNK